MDVISNVATATTLRRFGSRVALFAGLLACCCSSNDVGVPDSVIGGAQIQSAVIPIFVSEGDPLDITVHTVEGCKYGEWVGATVRFESRNVYVETKAKISFEIPDDCTTRNETHAVRVSAAGAKGSSPLPSGVWNVFVKGRNKPVTGKVTVG